MQALVVNGFEPYYWESAGKAELDFVVQDAQGNIVPVEVKSAANVRARSLSVFVSRYSPAYSIRISAKISALKTASRASRCTGCSVSNGDSAQCRRIKTAPGNPGAAAFEAAISGAGRRRRRR